MSRQLLIERSGPSNRRAARGVRRRPPAGKLILFLSTTATTRGEQVGGPITMRPNGGPRSSPPTPCSSTNRTGLRAEGKHLASQRSTRRSLPPLWAGWLSPGERLLWMAVNSSACARR